MRAPVLRFDAPVPYAAAARLQEALVERRLGDRIPDLVLLLQHAPVITLGRRGRREFLLSSAERLAGEGIAVEVAPRGGDVTYHGPGQWVLYPIVRLDGKAAGAHGYLHRLEEIAIRTAGAFGVRAYRRPGKSGAWTDGGKLAAIGFRIRRWVTSHGMSFNVDPDLAGFSHIVPCGLVGEPVTSLAALLGARAPSLGEAATVLIGRCSEVFHCALTEHPAEDVPADDGVDDWLVRTLGSRLRPDR